MSKTVSKIAKLLVDIETIAELNDVIDCVKQTQRHLKVANNRNARATMVVGDKVKFTSDSRFADQFGTILEIKRSKAIVDIDGQRWNCPLIIMEVV
jgi:transcription antitermination factor NusG|tara:strand:- start:504 stop:791 length:288 start_codon:yes stop_codon:yes gene_type:complete